MAPTWCVLAVRACQSVKIEAKQRGVSRRIVPSTASGSLAEKALVDKSNVDEGSRQIGFVTLGKEVALKAARGEQRGPGTKVFAPAALQRAGGEAATW